MMTLAPITARAQINTDQVLRIGKNALYFEDYILSIQYFNQVIAAKPFLAEPYYYRAVAKISLDDYRGAEEDATLCIERNPFIVDVYQVRGVARLNQDKVKEAMADFRKGLEMAPYDKNQLLNLAACQVQEKDLDGADSTLSTLKAIDGRNDRVHLGLAHLHLERGDTATAINDALQSLECNSNNLQAHLLLAQVAVKQDSLGQVLTHLDEAIKLDPMQTSLYINRAYVRYKQDDYYGAMADFDYALQLEPDNTTARYNRAMLCAEVAENDKAVDDFTKVLSLEPDNFLALYNRAILLMKTGQYRRAINDYDLVLKRYPKFEGGYLMRADAKRRAGDNAGAERDIKQAVAVMKSKGIHKSDYNPAKIENEKLAKRMSEAPTPDDRLENEEEIMNRFNEMMTVKIDDSFKPEYANRSRGRVQNAQMEIQPEPFFSLSYYTPADDDLSYTRTHYMQEVAELNDAHLLPMTLTIANHDVQLSSDDINRHFASIEYFNSIIAQGSTKPIDFIARAIDQLIVKNPDGALADADRALELTPGQPIALFVKACAHYRAYQMKSHEAGNNDATATDEQRSAQLLRQREAAKLLDQTIDDLRLVIKQSPRNAYAHYDLGIVYNEMQNYTAAIAAFSDAIAISPNLGEAYYNRGLLYLRLGNKAAGVNDLSKAGELGILPSYTILKRFQ